MDNDIQAIRQYRKDGGARRDILPDPPLGECRSLVQPKWTRWWTLFYKRQYVIDKIKKPLMKAITILANRYPEPTKDHTSHPNTHRLIDIRNKFFEYENNPNPSRDALFRALWRMLIIEYEHDPYYRDRLDWIIEEVGKSGWGIESPRHYPTKCWKEPKEE